MKTMDRQCFNRLLLYSVSLRSQLEDKNTKHTVSSSYQCGSIPGRGVPVAEVVKD